MKTWVFVWVLDRCTWTHPSFIVLPFSSTTVLTYFHSNWSQLLRWKPASPGNDWWIIDLRRHIWLALSASHLQNIIWAYGGWDGAAAAKRLGRKKRQSVFTCSELWVTHPSKRWKTCLHLSFGFNLSFLFPAYLCLVVLISWCASPGFPSLAKITAQETSSLAAKPLQ